MRNALAEGHTVLGISRSVQPHFAFLPYYWEPKVLDRFQFIQADINTDLPLVSNSIRNLQPQVVVNFAAQSMVGQSWEHPQDWYRTNTVSLSKFVNDLQNLQSLEKYVHVTTPEVYGSTPEWISENSNFAPSTPYAVSRAAGDWHLMALYRATGFPVVFTRAANVYGPGQQIYRIVPRAILSARLNRELPLHGGGESKRSFIHIQDVVDVTLKLSQSGVSGETYHISTDELISIKDLVFKVFDMAGVDSSSLVALAKDRVGKDSGYFLDSSKLKSQFEWRPQVNLDTGIRETIDWVDSNLQELGLMPTEYLHRP